MGVLRSVAMPPPARPTALAAEPLAITGRGLVSACGAGVRALAQRLRAPRAPAAARLPASVARGLAHDQGARIPEALVDPQDRLRSALEAALREALEEAGIDPRTRTVGLALGTALGDTDRADRALEPVPPGADPRAWLALVAPHALTLDLARRLGLTGPCTTASVTCASGSYALEQAALDLATGRADAMLVAGADALGRLTQAGFSALGALADALDPAGNPLDGLVLGEAACALVLERGAPSRTRAVLRGRGLAADASHLTTPDASGKGMARAITRALAMADVAPREVGLVATSAVGSPAYAALYQGALGAVFGATAPPVASWESRTAHALAATTTLGAIYASLAFDGAHGEPALTRPALTLTVGFGGQNGALVLAPIR